LCLLGMRRVGIGFIDRLGLLLMLITTGMRLEGRRVGVDGKFFGR